MRKLAPKISPVNGFAVENPPTGKPSGRLKNQWLQGFCRHRVNIRLDVHTSIAHSVENTANRRSTLYLPCAARSGPPQAPFLPRRHASGMRRAFAHGGDADGASSARPSGSDAGKKISALVAAGTTGPRRNDAMRPASKTSGRPCRHVIDLPKKKTAA